MNVNLDPTTWLDRPITELLFHYTCESAALEGILYRGEIEFGQLSHSNDPYERLDWDLSPGGWGVSSDNIIKTDFSTSYIKQLSRIFCTTLDTPQQTSHSRGYAIPALWSHYASRDRGVCLVFDKEKFISNFKLVAKNSSYSYFCEEIIYNSPLHRSAKAYNLDITGVQKSEINDAIGNHIRSYYRDLYFLKDRSWSYEKEFRFLVIVKNDEEIFNLSIADTLFGIVLGANFSEAYEPLINSARKKFSTNSARLIWEQDGPSIYPCP